MDEGRNIPSLQERIGFLVRGDIFSSDRGRNSQASSYDGDVLVALVVGGVSMAGGEGVEFTISFFILLF